MTIPYSADLAVGIVAVVVPRIVGQVTQTTQTAQTIPAQVMTNKKTGLGRTVQTILHAQEPATSKGRRSPFPIHELPYTMDHTTNDDVDNFQPTEAELKLGLLNYNQYCYIVKTTFDGRKLPAWDEKAVTEQGQPILTEKIRKGWVAGALAVSNKATGMD
jgi:hypothetical protein